MKNAVHIRVTCLFACFCPAIALGQTKLTPAQEARRTPITDVVQRTRDAVVNIAATQVIDNSTPFTTLDEMFLGPRNRRGATSLGTGFIIHPDGYVVTNAHVIQEAAEQKVIFADKTEFEADKVAIDEQHDLAILRIKAKRLFPALPMGRSDDLMIGETVLAIGNPLGYGHTVTMGIVSAVDRELSVREGNNDVKYQHLIQTDASINRGNSGGPLLNIAGELIGINTVIRGDAQNIGFAIPVDDLRKLIPDLLSTEQGKSRVEVGLRLGWRNDMHVVEAKGPAAQAGIEAGDELVSLDGQKLKNDIDFYVHLLGLKAGTKLKIEVDHEGKKIQKVVEVQAIPVPDGAKLLRDKFGLNVRLITPEEARSANIKGGLLITSVDQDTPAAELQLRRGMIIDQVGQYFPDDLDSLGLVLEKMGRGQKVSFRVLVIGQNFIQGYSFALPAR